MCIVNAAARPVVTLVASRALDRMVDANGEVVEMPGGPALYAGDALRRLHCPYILLTNQCASVTVLPGQLYLVPHLPPIPLPSRFDTPAVILNPIANEIPIPSVPPYHGLLAVDIQGFVRRPGLPSSQPAHDVDLSALLSRSTVVKASESELACLAPAARRAMRHAILLVTQAERGATLQWNGRTVHVSAHPVTGVHTIGAGDMFLAAFVHALISGTEPISAAQRASMFVAAMLRERA